jgi:membrane protein YqaA with SNARE-associated domain
MHQLALHYGYLGIFIISFLGAVSIFLPIPYTVIIFTLGGFFDPVLIAISAGLGSALGEIFGYLLGFYARRAISEKKRRQMEFMVKVFNHFGPITVFLFALTPLPDDLLFIPLGIMHYSLIKVFIPALIGKICMNFIVAYSGRFSIDIIRKIFGEESDWLAMIIGTILAVVLLGIVMIIMFKLDWEKIFHQYIEKKKKTETSKK